MHNAATLQPRLATLPMPAAAAAPEAGNADDSPRCGWFESSRELRQGLLISELPVDDLTVAALWFPALERAASAAWQ